VLWVSSPKKTPSGRPPATSGVSESCLRNWMNRDAIDTGRKPGLTTGEHKGFVEARRRIPVLECKDNENVERQASSERAHAVTLSRRLGSDASTRSM